MKKRVLLEISVESLDAAVAAVRGGADRIELCENLAVGGITPRAELMREARRQVRVPVFAMIRPRGGDFVYTAAELQEMKREIKRAREAAMDGVVLGILTRDRQVDTELTAELVRLARPMPVTFHRAFDELAALERGLEEVVATGAARILTSGGKATAEEGCAAIARLALQARGRILILPGGGIRSGNVGRVVREAGAREVHSGLSHLLPTLDSGTERFEAAVREMARLLEDQARVLAGRPG
jgi:copper homeostasis protein